MPYTAALAEPEGFSEVPLVPRPLQAPTRRVSFECPECDETVRGLPGEIGKCSYCGTWLDVPSFEAD